jgi:hypothetical protein
MPNDEATGVMAGGDLEPHHGGGLRVASRMPIVLLFLLAILLGAVVAGGASYALRVLNL